MLAFLFKDKPIYPLVIWRILFGALMLISTARFIALGWIEDHYIEPIIHFKYYGFAWINPMGTVGMYAVHYVMIIASLMVIVGYYYRMAAVVLFLLFTYTELIDLTYYLNHYVFLSYMSFIMIFLPAHKCLSIDVLRGKTTPAVRVQAWATLAPQLLIAIVYMYAGMAKINSTWLLDALPLKIWLPSHSDIPMIGGLLTQRWTPYAFSWIGMLYDCSIVLLLMWQRSRKWAFLSVVLFHLLTGILFQIGVFPVAMIAAATMFFSAEWHHRLVTWMAHNIDKRQVQYLSIAPQPQAKRQRLVATFFALFFAFQLLFPWRYLCYDNNMYWSEEGYRFGWRVMLMEKAGTATFYVKDGNLGKEGEVINTQFLNAHQEKQMAMQPDLILQYAHHLRKHYAKNGMRNPQVRAEVYVTLNGAPSQLLIDPKVDLSKLSDGWSQKKWITKFQK